MDLHLRQVLDEALSLPAQDRSVIAVALIDSLDGSDDASITTEWRAELLKRRDDLRSGRSRAQPWAEVRARITAL